MTVGAQYAALSKRAVVNIFRQPASFVPAMVFPLLFMAMTAGALDKSTALPGFPPADSFLQFLFATTILQASLFGSIAAGSDMAVDIQEGFFERLIASPVDRTAILVGRLAGAALLGFIQTWFFFGVTTIFGLEIEGGLIAVAAMSIVSALLSAGVGAVMVAFGIKTGSSEAVQGSFPMLFVLMFLSSAFFPRALMHGWFKAVATANPLSHLIESMRHLVTVGWSMSDFLSSLAVAVAVLVIGVVVSGRALASRIAAA